MNEIFPREAAADPEPFTGERLTSALSGQTQVEHYHRYLFARGLCRGLDVLDVASGEGYGSALLAQVARSVVGVEYSAPTVRSAQYNFPRGNLTFLQGDARALPLHDAGFDVVVSFETIEHFDRQAAFVAEVRRVLRPDGCFIVSTPDREIYSAPGTPPNPFHVQEMSLDAFRALLWRQFPYVTILHQRPMSGSALVPVGANPLLVFDRLDQDRFEACEGLPRAPYLVAVASGRPVPPMPASLYIDHSDLDTVALALAAAQAEMARREEAADAELTRLTRALDQARSSLRGFLRYYLPRLRRHWFGR